MQHLCRADSSDCVTVENSVAGVLIDLIAGLHGCGCRAGGTAAVLRTAAAAGGGCGGDGTESPGAHWRSNSSWGTAPEGGICWGMTA